MAGEGVTIYIHIQHAVLYLRCLHAMIEAECVEKSKWESSEGQSQRIVYVLFICEYKWYGMGKKGVGGYNLYKVRENNPQGVPESIVCQLKKRTKPNRATPKDKLHVNR